MNVTVEIEEVEPEFRPVKVTVTVLLTSKEELQGLANEDGKVIHAIVYSVTDHAKGMMLERIRDVAQPPVDSMDPMDPSLIRDRGRSRIGPRVPRAERIKAFNRRVKNREQVAVDKTGTAPSPVVFTESEKYAQHMRNKFPNHGDGGYGEVFKDAEFCPIA